MSARTPTVAGHELDRSTLPLLVTLGLGVFAGALDLGVLAPALPAFARTFGVPTGELAWIFTLYLLVNVVSIAVMSSLADRYGRRSIYIACVAIFALGSVVAVVASNYTIFLAARAIQAFGAGGIFPVATAAIGDRVPLARRGAALGMVAATWGVAAVVGPLIGGIVTHVASWRWIFAANFPLAIAVIALARRYVPAQAPRVRGPLDVAGLILLSAGLLDSMAALTHYRAWEGVAGIGLFATFALVEQRAETPILPPVLFAKRQLIVTYALEFVIGILEGALFFVPAALIAAQHLSYAFAGAIAAIGAVTFVAVIPASGRALDQVGPRVVLLAGTAMTSLGLWLFAWGLGSTPASIVAMVVAGLGFGALLGAPTRYIVTGEVSQAHRATAVGLLSQFLIFGQIVGASIIGGVLLHGGPDVLGFRTAYALFAALGLPAIALAALLGSRRQALGAAQHRERSA
ncbi:MAG: MFS transporter [Candidatus Eremiobacteraeota bacterium]|nr:MFS transporter [Candidatus Eremiobacteraeota bacterium]